MNARDEKRVALVRRNAKALFKALPEPNNADEVLAAVIALAEVVAETLKMTTTPNEGLKTFVSLVGKHLGQSIASTDVDDGS